MGLWAYAFVVVKCSGTCSLCVVKWSVFAFVLVKCSGTFGLCVVKWSVLHVCGEVQWNVWLVCVVCVACVL